VIKNSLLSFCDTIANQSTSSILLSHSAAKFYTDCLANDAERKLVTKLLENYNPMVRPTHHFHDVINLTFTVTLQQIVDLVSEGV